MAKQRKKIGREQSRPISKAAQQKLAPAQTATTKETPPAVLWWWPDYIG